MSFYKIFFVFVIALFIAFEVLVSAALFCVSGFIGIISIVVFSAFNLFLMMEYEEYGF